MAKPKLALIPAAQGSKFYSVLPSSGVGDFTFSRSGSATRINSQGLIETVANGVSRLNYPMIDGVVKGCPHHILEPQRTNLFTYSQTFQGWSNLGTNTTTVQNNAISPDGSLNALKIKGSSDNSNNGLAESFTITSGVQSYSIFAKAGEVNILQVGFGGSFGNTYANVNLTNGVVEVESNQTTIVSDYGNGWYRVTSIATATATAGYWFINIGDDPNMGRNGNYIGNGTDGIYLFGVQTEQGQGSYPTSYIPTNGSTVTRSAETAIGSGDADTFNDSEGVLMAEIDVVADSTEKWISISDGNTTNRIILYISSSNTLRIFVGASGTQVDMNEVVNLDSYNKIAFKYKQNDFALWVNGIELDTDTNGNTPSNLNVLNLSNSNGLSNHFIGSLKQLQYFETALTDSELETLTSWVSFSDMANGQLYTIQ
jgi:hypothetical protein